MGDGVCIFLGSHIPFILRPFGSSHKLVGQCYIHGIMIGEALPRSDFHIKELSSL